MSRFLTPQGGDADCCCGGFVCESCKFEFQNCQIFWECSDPQAVARIYQGETLVAESSHGVIGNPFGTYRLEQFCNGIFIGSKQLTVPIGPAIDCSTRDCCVSLGKSPCSTIVATVSGFPDLPGYNDMNGSYVLPCVFASDGAGCFYQILRRQDYTGCSGPQGELDPSHSIGFIWWYLSVSIDPNGPINVGISYWFLSRRNNPPCVDFSETRTPALSPIQAVAGFCVLPTPTTELNVPGFIGGAFWHSQFNYLFGDSSLFPLTISVTIS